MTKNLYRIQDLKFKILLALILIFGAAIRFYNINWGAPFYFHPDERNIASSVSQLEFPTQLNPHFFAYGSLPLYTIYFLGMLWNFFSHSQSSIPLTVSFQNAIITSRLVSAFLSTALIPLVYLAGKKIGDKKTGLLAAFFTTTSIGLVQFSHFGTFEMWLTFFGTLLFYLCLKLAEKGDIKNVLFCGIVLGILVSTKISSLAIAPIPFLSIIFGSRSRKKQKRNVRKIFAKFMIIAAMATAMFVMTSPFVVLDHPSFLSSINYESSVVLGTLHVFYTGEFYGAVPIFFQLTKIYPFILNPFMTAVFILSLIYVIYIACRKKNISVYLLLAICCLLFLSQAFFFAKWTRYMIPTLPFIYLIISMAVSDFILYLRERKDTTKIYQYTGTFTVIFLVVANTVFSLSFLRTVYFPPDTRIRASLWAKRHILENTKILSETYDLGILPFNPYFPNITLFNFYGLDNNPFKRNQLYSMLNEYDYIILPSQRIMHTRLSDKKRFPQGYKFYKALFDGTLGFKKIYQTPCDIFCKTTYLGSSIFKPEETSSVFDRPTVFIFKRNL